MADSTGSDERGGFPAALIGMLVLVLVVEGFFARREFSLFLDVQTWQWKQTAKTSRHGMPRSELVFFGDSLFKGGIAPTVVEEATGRQAYNLSVSGGQPSSSFFLLKALLKGGRRPDAVVVENLPTVLEIGPWSNQPRWPALLKSAECFDLARTARDPELFSAIMLARVLPSYRARWGVRANVRASLRGEDQFDRHFVPPNLARNQRVNKGSVIFPEQAVAPTLTNDSDDGVSPTWACHPVNAEYLRRFFALAASKRIPVVWVLPPMHPALQKRGERSGFDRRFTQFVRQAAAPFPNVTVVDGRQSNYPPKVFIDTIHLVRPGAAVLSADLGVILRRALGNPDSPRWVALPPYRAVETVAVEDLEDSKAILRERLTKR